MSDSNDIIRGVLSGSFPNILAAGIDRDGNIYIADYPNGTVKKIMAVDHGSNSSSNLNLSLDEKLRKARNLQKGIYDWGHVYSQLNDKWYQKKVEEKVAFGKKELARMKADLAKHGITLSNNNSKAKVPAKVGNNGLRKIFILDKDKS